MGRRMLLLVSALVVAAVGTLLIFAYVRSADDRALKDQQPVEVLVATTLIRADTLGSAAERQGAFELKRIPRAAVAAGALGDPRPIADLVAVSDIFPGEQILKDKFGPSGATSILNVPTGMIAISVQLGDPNRVAGFLKPGSDVVVFLTADVDVNGRTVAGGVTTVLLPTVNVLAIGPTTLRSGSGQANTEALPTAIMTLAVNQEQAQKLIHAQRKGTLYFGLRNDDSKITPNRPTFDANLFD